MSSTEEDHISVIFNDPVQDQPVNGTLFSQGETTVTSNKNNEKNYFLPISENIAERLFGELFGNPDFKSDICMMHCLAQTCFVLAGLIDGRKGETYDLHVVHLIIMTRFVLEDPDEAGASTFIKFYNSQPESKDYPLEDVSSYYVNYVFCSLLNISLENENARFKDIVYSLFPRGRDVLSHKRKNIGPFPSVNRSIDLSMEKMKNFLLDFEVKQYFDQHLELKGHKIWICHYGYERQVFMRNFKDNRVAQLYGIETVGMEILKTFTSLANSKESKDIMLDYDVWKGFNNLDNAVFELNNALTKDLGYTVLADKFFGLERKINSFWYRFQREADHRRIYKPVDYYFIIFSVFLGFLTMVQTISGIISLIFQVKSS
ncbi:hypothetical protein Glove_355g83 [Diversispora epigaea]|uniref:Uncharacterized protein n=1 Tax=Diversispora epigaea TaxID=1348612 RepID=A0A397HE38_9GLOM|nr:hypothetical protein Glove_355g83 [Diversispora epigaea]